MKLKLLSAALLLISSGTASVMADAVLTVNGQKVEKTVTRLTFEGDNVKVTFGDNSTSSHDMEDVSFSFVPSAGIETISSFGTLSVTVGDRLEISGTTNGCRLQVFDLQGRLSVQATAMGDTCEIDISHLEGGAYILKAGNDIVKFFKR
ncbi:MAG: T9SS type A sorting domain-containing protein [Muribaculaceae bacterium]|nr:T9SS type A sorting domain-containing protein [Muribaculaceae bacterium]